MFYFKSFCESVYMALYNRGLFSYTMSETVVRYNMADMWSSFW